jgi:hypothetical protein
VRTQPLHSDKQDRQPVEEDGAMVIDPVGHAFAHRHSFSPLKGAVGVWATAACIVSVIVVS